MTVSERRSEANDVSLLWRRSSWSRSWRLERAYTRPVRHSLTAVGTNFGLLVRLVDVINCAKFYRNRLRVWILWGVEVWPYWIAMLPLTLLGTKVPLWKVVSYLPLIMLAICWNWYIGLMLYLTAALRSTLSSATVRHSTSTARNFFCAIQHYTACLHWFRTCLVGRSTLRIPKSASHCSTSSHLPIMRSM